MAIQKLPSLPSIQEKQEEVLRNKALKVEMDEMKNKIDEI
jgi:hypothetical protein